MIQSLQRENATIEESQTLFQYLIDIYQNFQFNLYLSFQASIVHSGALRYAIVMIQPGSEYQMLYSEEADV